MPELLVVKAILFLPGLVMTAFAVEDLANGRGGCAYQISMVGQLLIGVAMLVFVFLVW